MAPPIKTRKSFKVPAEIIAQFQSTPWALKFFEDSDYVAFTNESRNVKPTTTADTFVSKTLATDDTIKAWQSFSSRKNGEVLSLLSLGSGINGHVDTSHGGFISLLHDESLGLAAENAKPLDKTTMTAYLKVDYKKPMRTPSVILCRAWVEKKEGRKVYIRGEIEDGRIFVDTYERKAGSSKVDRDTGVLDSSKTVQDLAQLIGPRITRPPALDI